MPILKADGSNWNDPVLGKVDLTMELSAPDRMAAEFHSIRRTDRDGQEHSYPSFGADLMRQKLVPSNTSWPDYRENPPGRTWATDSSGGPDVIAGFYRVGDDPIGAVAGVVDRGLGLTGDRLVGAFGALRE
jgi:hypothetical protein